MSTKVVFRKFSNGDIIAVFPGLAWNRYDLASYQHIGQHGPCSRDIARFTKLATPEEFADLLRELQQIGYNDLQIMKKIIAA